MRKILYFITQSEYGGAQRYVFDLANNLKNDYGVAVALGEQGNNGKLAKILQKNNIKYFIIPRLKRSISPVNDLLALFEVVKLIKNYQPDIIHLNSSKISILGSLAAFVIRVFAVFAFHSQYSHSIRSIRIIYTVHGWVFNEPLPLWQKWFYLYAEKFTARFKNKIICVSERDRQIALKYKIAPENKLVTIHNGIAPVDLYSKEEATKKIYSLPPLLAKETRQTNVGLGAGGEVLVGSIGNLYRTKGFEYFVQAADMLINKFNTQATFVIIGEGSERKNLEILINKHNLKNNFILAGRIDDAARLLPALDIYVCSSVKEGFPYSVLEAMAASLPIVSTNISGIPEMITNNKTGLLVEPADSNNLAEKIKTLLDNKTLAAEIGQNAKAKVRSEFNLEKMVEETKEVYLFNLSA